MKTPVIGAAVGLIAGLIVCGLSGRQRPEHLASEDVREVVRSTPTVAARPTARAATVTGDTARQPLERDREEQSRRLQLEIERALVSLDEVSRERAYTQLLPGLIAIDPAAVERLVERCPAGPVREQLLRYTALAWSAANLEGAVDWVEAMKDRDERLIAANEVVSQVAQTDPAQAIEVSDLFGIGRSDGTVEHIAQLWAVEDLSGALQWVQAQPGGPQRDQLFARIVAVQAESAPADAARSALTQIAPGPRQDDAVTSVLQRWSAQDPDAASAWVEELPKGHVRGLAEAEVTRSAQR